MKYVLSIGLIACCVLALYFSLHFLFSKEHKNSENRLYALFCISSAIWSFGFGGLILQTNPDIAYLWRAFGMIGVFLYLILAQIIVSNLSDLPKFFRYLFNGIAFTGVIIYFFVVQKNQTIYYIDDFGMTYHFNPGLWNTIYTSYSVIVSIDLMISVIYILRTTKLKRTLAFCKKFLLAEGVIVLGMVFDTVCPLLGMPALPGSSTTQFLGLLLIYDAARSLERTRINISNMSEFIYYSLRMPVLLFDSDKRLRILNDAAYTFFDIDPSVTEIENIRIEQLFELEEDIFSFEGKQQDLDTTCQNNQLYCNLSVNEIDDKYGDTTGYIILVTDLSERMKTIQALQDAIVEAECANQAKTTFLANMSHEIRTPMNSITVFSELLLKMDLSPKVREYVSDIKWASHNLLAIINDILDISKIESGKMELVCDNYYIGSLLGDVSIIISTQAKKKGLDFFMDIEPSIPNMLYGDKIRIRGILINLLNNAVKYTESGSVTLTASIKEKTSDTITLEFKISDTGQGIKEEDIATLFDSFEQLNQKIHYGVEGSGLGLAIVKGYINLMDGNITVNSVYGEGSVFTVTISQKVIDHTPMEHNFSHKDDSVTNNSISNMKINGIRVLVVDDNQVNLKVASNSFSYYGLDVDTATDGFTAIEFCRKNQYPIIFLDHMMPDMDGVETMKQIRRLNPYYNHGGESKIIVLTANAVSGVRTQLMQLGFDEYLGKPINFKQLERLFVRFLPPESISYHQEENSGKTLLSDDDVVLILLNIRKCVDTFDFTKIFDMLEETKKYQLPDTYKDTFRKLDALMDELAVEEIQELLANTLA